MKLRFKSKSEWTSIHMSFNPGLNEAQKVINARNKRTANCFLTFSHYARPQLEYADLFDNMSIKVYVKNKLGCQICVIVYKFKFD